MDSQDLKFNKKDFKDYMVCSLTNGKEVFYPKEDHPAVLKQAEDKNFVKLERLLKMVRKGEKQEIIEFEPEADMIVNRRYILSFEEVWDSISVILNVPLGLQTPYNKRTMEFAQRLGKMPSKDELIGIAITFMKEIKEATDKAKAAEVEAKAEAPVEAKEKKADNKSAS